MLLGWWVIEAYYCCVRCARFHLLAISITISTTAINMYFSCGGVSSFIHFLLLAGPWVPGVFSFFSVLISFDFAVFISVINRTDGRTDGRTDTTNFTSHTYEYPGKVLGFSPQSNIIYICISATEQQYQVHVIYIPYLTQDNTPR